MGDYFSNEFYHQIISLGRDVQMSESALALKSMGDSFTQRERVQDSAELGGRTGSQSGHLYFLQALVSGSIGNFKLKKV